MLKTRSLRSFALAAQVLLAGLFISAMVACSSIGLQAPQSAQDSLQYAKETLAGTYTAVANAVSTGSLTGAEGEAILKQAATAEDSLKAADALLAAPGTVDTATAVGKINAALLVLQAVSAELKAHLPPAAAAASAPK